MKMRLLEARRQMDGSFDRLFRSSILKVCVDIFINIESSESNKLNHNNKSSGNIWNPIQSIIVSHVIDEGSLFLFQNGSNNNSTFLDDYLQSIIPKYAQSGDIIPRIKALYKT